MALCEAMMIGMPVVGLATTELPTVLENGRSGIVHTNPERLIEGARELLKDRSLAARLGAAAREIALERFSIARFTRDWEAAFRDVIGRSSDRIVVTSGTPGRRNRVREEVPA